MSEAHADRNSRGPLSSDGCPSITRRVAASARLLNFPQMTVILQGSLRHFPPWQLLPFLACSVDLATLQVEGGVPARLWLRGGRAVWGESPGGNDVVSAAAAMLAADGGMFMVSDSIEVPDGAQDRKSTRLNSSH